MSDKEWLREAIVKQPWFESLVQDKAMELLGELLESDGETDGKPKAHRDNHYSYSKLGSQVTDSPKVKDLPKPVLVWRIEHLKEGGLNRGAFIAEGLRGEQLRVVRGKKRGHQENSVFHWWHVFVDNVEIAQVHSRKVGQLRAEKEVMN